MYTETGLFAGKISKNRLVCKNAVALAYCGSCRLLVMGSWFTLDLPQVDLMNLRVEYVRPRSGRFLGREAAERGTKSREASSSGY